MKKFLILVPVLALMTLAACQQKAAAPAPAAATATPVAIVNGHSISTETFDFYVKNRANKPTAELTAEQKQQLLDELIRIDLTAQQATKEGLDKQADVEQRLEFSRQQVLADAVVQNY